MAYLLDANVFIQARNLHDGSTLPARRLTDRGKNRPQPPPPAAVGSGSLAP